MRNRPVQHREDHACSLRPGRTYRAVVVVCGETSLEELEDTLVESGFDRRSLLLAIPDQWRHVCPKDWPDEPELEGLSANECIVRIMGDLHSAGPVFFRKDVPLPDDAFFTIAQAWEYSAPLEETGGQSPAPARQEPRRGFGLASVIAVGAATLACGWYFSQRSAKRQEKEREAMFSMLREEEDERAELERLELARLEARAEDEDMAPGREGVHDAARELAGERLRFERALARNPERRREVLALLEEGR